MSEQSAPHTIQLSSFFLTTFMFALVFVFFKMFLRAKDPFIKSILAILTGFCIFLNCLLVIINPVLIVNYILKFIIILKIFDDFRQKKYPCYDMYTQDWFDTLCHALNDPFLCKHFLEVMSEYAAPIIKWIIIIKIIFYCGMFYLIWRAGGW